MIRRTDGRSPGRATRGTRRLALPFVAVLAALAPVAAAQTLGEVTLVVAISSQLHPGVSLPSGSLRAEGPGAVDLIARIPDAASWTDWEVYTARGIAMALENAVVYGAERDLAVAGYFRTVHEERTVGGDRHVRLEFEGHTGRALVYVIREPDALVWLLARSR